MEMQSFKTRYQAMKEYPGAIIRMAIKNAANVTKGSFVVFHARSTYERWKMNGIVR